FPGKFLLSYQPNQKAFHEFITATPDGFKYRNNVFKSIHTLFKWFKDHYKDRSTFTRTPGPQTPIINASPYVSQRTPQSTTSPYVSGSNKPGFVPTPNINPQAIQRAAASLPNHLFNTLSQVTGQTSSFNGNFGPSSNTAGIPLSANNNYNVTQRPNLYPVPSATTAGIPYGTGQTTMMPPPPPPPPALNTMPVQNNRLGHRGGNQWSDLLKQQSTTDWHSNRNNNYNNHNRTIPTPIQAPLSSSSSLTSTQQQQSSMMIQTSNINKTPVYSTPGASSQMSISPMQEEISTPNITKGDQTPLVDEWN
ncbi:hypothetical protein BLA29_007451, partial [Euroglyphus maynei]